MSRGFRVLVSSIACALALFVLVLPAIAQDSGGSDGSETTGQDVSVSEGDEGPSNESGGGGPSCSGGSEVTVTTDKGTSHPPSGGTCRTDPAPAPVVQQTRTTSSSNAATAPTATPEVTPSASPTVLVQASPYISLPAEAPATKAKASGQGLGIPIALIFLAIALAAGGYLVLSAVRRILGRVTQSPSHADRDWRVPFIEDSETVRLVPKPPPTEPIALGGGPEPSSNLVELTFLPLDTGTEADILAALERQSSSPD